MWTSERLNNRDFILAFFLFPIATCCCGVTPAKRSCQLNEATNCIDEFNGFADNPSTKAIYIHLKGANISDTNKTVDPIKEFVWVNKSSEYLLSYPDDFHALTFGIIYKNIFEMDIVLENNTGASLGSPNDSVHLLYMSVFGNNSKGYVCHRIATDPPMHRFRKFFGVGLDYICSSYESDGMHTHYISKMTTSMILIIAMCIFVMIWFPRTFPLKNENKFPLPNILYENIQDTQPSSHESTITPSLSRDNTNVTIDLSDVKPLTERNVEISDRGNAVFSLSIQTGRKARTSDTYSMVRYADAPTVSQRHNTVSEVDNDIFTDHYSRGDVPYGLQRFLKRCLHSHVIPVRKSNETRVWSSNIRFLSILTFCLTIFYALIQIFTNDDYPLDTPRNEITPGELYSLVGISTPELLSEGMFFSYFMILCCSSIVFCAATILSSIDFLCPHNSVILDLSSIGQRLKTFDLKPFLNVSHTSDNLFASQVNRCSLLIRFKFWNSLTQMSFRWMVNQTEFTWKLLLFFPCFLAWVFNIVTHVITGLIPLTRSIFIFTKIRGKLSTFVLKKCGTLTLLCLIVHIIMFSLLLPSPLYAMAILVKMFCYIFLIVIPQLTSFQFKTMIFLISAVSYTLRHLNRFLELYRVILETIFLIHYELGKTVNYVNIKEFDFIVSHVFPVYIQIIYCILKIIFTTMFFYISFSSYIGMPGGSIRAYIELNTMLGFAFIILIPGVLELILNTSTENKVALQYDRMQTCIQIYIDMCNKSTKNNSLPQDFLICGRTSRQISEESRSECEISLTIYDCLFGFCCRNIYCWHNETISESVASENDENIPNANDEIIQKANDVNIRNAKNETIPTANDENILNAYDENIPIANDENIPKANGTKIIQTQKMNIFQTLMMRIFQTQMMKIFQTQMTLMNRIYQSYIAINR